MKKLVLILFLALPVIQANGKNSDDDLLKSPVKLSDIADIGNTECDLCGCYMGLDPNFAMNQVGIRYSLIKFFAEAHTDPLTDHPTNGEESNEYYNDLEFYVRYYINPKFRLLFSIPFSVNEINGKKLNGMGDSKFLAQYQVYNSEITAKTVLWQRLFLGGGLNLPTGVYNKTLTYGVVEPHFQPGTGSFDFMMTALHLAKLEKVGLGWRNDVVYTVNGKNKNEYSFGNRFNWTSTLFYELPASDWTFLPHTGIYFESARQDKQNGTAVDDSGGDVLFGTGGLDIYYKEFSLDMNFQFPLNQKLIGDQSENKFRIYTGLGYAF